MSAHITRAQLLLQQSRAAEAENEASLAIAQAPDHPQAYSLLALSRMQQNKNQPALEAARAALGLAPDHAYFHYILALALYRLDQTDKALQTMADAIRLDPNDADHFCLLAEIHLELRNWTDALTASEQALALSPEHTGAANLRAMALVRLGRKDEAVNTVNYALERDPESAFSHSNQGWNCLHQNNPKEALEHFREALRLDPELDYAREGMVEALKARNPIYRAMLSYFLWMGRLSDRYQWAIVIGIYFGSRVLLSFARTYPSYKAFWWVVLSAFYGFVYLTWTAHPMFNLFLRLDRFGRYALSAEQRVASNWFGPFFAAAVAATVWFFATDSDASFFAMFCLAALSICVAVTFSRTGKTRWGLGAATTALAALAASALAPLLRDTSASSGALTLFIFGFLAFQILANFLK